MPPDRGGAPGSAFLALHPEPDAGFAANITVDGARRSDAATLPEIADGSVARLRGAGTAVEVVVRREVGSAEAPGLTQTLTVSGVVGGVPRDLVQSQVYLAMPDDSDPSEWALIRLVLTATSTQHPVVLPDFQEFVRTVRPDTAAGA
ncbi:hypothetical protein [Streptomyces sp. NPDC008150]|uniref:hypothetical protein n=1 Tax=Streptomyces sp. NPDC008150 TaxID=3364816 RepID=UPI0036E3D09E